MKSTLFCFIFGIGFSGMGQASGQSDTLKAAGKKNNSPADTLKKEYKNTIRFNLTNPVLLSDKALIFGYERILNSRQSFSINMGRASMPKFFSIGSDTTGATFELKKGTTEKGFNCSADYRFYLTKLNAFNAPRGVYIGPFYAYNFFERENTWTLNTEAFMGDVTTDYTLNTHTVGFELGYQFVFWKRLALDFILFGPGVAWYSIKTNVSTTLDPDDQAELFQRINDALAEKIPGYSLIIDAKEYETTGRVSTTSLGFRYMIHVGFRF